MDKGHPASFLGMTTELPTGWGYLIRIPGWLELFAIGSQAEFPIQIKKKKKLGAFTLKKKKKE